MSQIGLKRRIPTKIEKMKSRKRQKLRDGSQGQFPDIQSTDLNKRKSVKGYSTDNVRLDDLKWQSVPMPDHMEDYEGFYGLEEVDNVDVVKDQHNGRVSFQKLEREKLENPRVHIEDRSKGSSQQLEASAHTLDHIENGDNSGSEWEGFEDEIDLQNQDSVSIPLVSQKGILKSTQQPKTQQKSEDKDVLDDTPFNTLENADIQSELDMSAWAPLKLSSTLSTSLSNLGFTVPTKVQTQAIPRIRSGQDLIGKSPTGSGKTLAFGIPIMEEILSSSMQGEQFHDHAVLAEKEESEYDEIRQFGLIIEPTRELAHQIDHHLTQLISNAGVTDINIATLTGGLSIQKQRRLLRRAQIVVATPGRLYEVLMDDQDTLAKMKRIKYLVIDEADRLLSEGHFKELEEVLNLLDKTETSTETNYDDASAALEGSPTTDQVARHHERQTLVFSATFSKDLQQKLSKKTFISKDMLAGSNESMNYLLQKLNFRSSKPAFVDVNPVHQMASNLREGLIECPGLEKDLNLYTILLHYPNARSLIFVNSISAVRRIVPLLTNLNIAAYPLHSSMEQKARLRSVEKFSASKLHGGSAKKSNALPSSTILVATDVAARGLDIPNVNLVIHYHVPRSADTYVHRSGRTARADKSGSSILMSSPEEAAGVRRLVAQVHSKQELGKKEKYILHPLSLETKILTRVAPRVKLAKKLADASIAKEKQTKQNDWLEVAADELGIDTESPEFDQEIGEGKQGGKGKAKKEKEKVARSMTKAEMRSARAELNDMLTKKVNTGVSERYITRGNIDIDKLLKDRERANSSNPEELGDLFLGSTAGLGFD